MVTELDIAGEFIYDGIHTFNQINVVRQGAQLFSFLYHVSVGLERLQKIILVLFEDINLENYERFESSLITHSHTWLNERICKFTDLSLSGRENDFLQLLTSFYKYARYQRYNLDSEQDQESQLVSGYIVKYLSANRINRSIFDENIVVTEEVKELFGRVIGSIAKKYYKLIRDGCKNNRTYTWELRNDSKQKKYFYLIIGRILYSNRTLLKELLVYLRNTKDSNAFMRYIKTVTPLEFDAALINEYIEDIGNGTIPQALIDEVETLYVENDYSVSRMEQVDVIGSHTVDFEYMDVHNCFLMLDNFVNGNNDCTTFAQNFPQMFALIDEDYVEELEDISEAFSDYLNGDMKDGDLKKWSNHILKSFAEFLIIT